MQWYIFVVHSPPPPPTRGGPSRHWGGGGYTRAGRGLQSSQCFVAFIAATPSLPVLCPNVLGSHRLRGNAIMTPFQAATSAHCTRARAAAKRRPARPSSALVVPLLGNPRALPHPMPLLRGLLGLQPPVVNGSPRTGSAATSPCPPSASAVYTRAPRAVVRRPVGPSSAEAVAAVGPLQSRRCYRPQP